MSDLRDGAIAIIDALGVKGIWRTAAGESAQAIATLRAGLDAARGMKKYADNALIPRALNDHLGFTPPTGMTQTALAGRTSVPLQRVNTLINGKRAVTADTALLLSDIFGTSPEFWMNLQAQRDLYAAQRRRNEKRAQRRSEARVRRTSQSRAARSASTHR